MWMAQLIIWAIPNEKVKNEKILIKILIKLSEKIKLTSGGKAVREGSVSN